MIGPSLFSLICSLLLKDLSFNNIMFLSNSMCLCITGIISSFSYIYIYVLYICTSLLIIGRNQRTIGPENAHLKPDLGVLSHHEMTLTLNTHTPLLTAKFQVTGCNSFQTQ